MDNYDIYVIGKLLQFFVEKNCEAEGDCGKCYMLCDNCPKSLIQEFLTRNDIK